MEISNSKRSRKSTRRHSKSPTVSNCAAHSLSPAVTNCQGARARWSVPGIPSADGTATSGDGRGRNDLTLCGNPWRTTPRRRLAVEDFSWRLLGDSLPCCSRVTLCGSSHGELLRDNPSLHGGLLAGGSSESFLFFLVDDSFLA